MIRRIQIWLLNMGVLTVRPWNDPRRSEADRALWLKSEPKSMRKSA